MRLVDLCPDCRRKVLDYQRERYVVNQLRRGAVARWYVSPARAATRLEQLLAAGESYRSIAAKAGNVSPSQLCRIVHDHRAGRRTKMRSDVADMILTL